MHASQPPRLPGGVLLCVALIAFPPGEATAAGVLWQQCALQDHAHDRLAANAPTRYTRTVARYELPDVTLVAMDGTKTALASTLKYNGPVMLQFIFTSCPTICLAMSSTLSAAQNKLGDDLGKIRMISISIDPEHDTPERLREYARRFRAGRQWLFLTGQAEDIAAVQKAFDTYRGTKMRHEPLTFMRAAPGKPWVRFDGLMNATQLVTEYKLLVER